MSMVVAAVVLVAVVLGGWVYFSRGSGHAAEQGRPRAGQLSLPEEIERTQALATAFALKMRSSSIVSKRRWACMPPPPAR